MMDEKRLYLVALMDEAANRELDGLNRTLVSLGLCQNPQLGIPFHITLASFDPQREAEVMRRARDVCARTDAFSLQLSGLGLFGLKVLFVAPAVNRELIGLHDALDPLQPTAGAHQWVPHVTLLIDEPDGNIQKAVPIVAEAFVPAVARVESVSVYEFPPARFVGRFPLRTSAPA
jgi:2'-5' RNA ligase